MANYRHVIEQAYRQILGRDPDPTGLADYDKAMNGTLTEAAMRESLLRSEEYARVFPGPAEPPLPPPPPAPGGPMGLSVRNGVFTNPAAQVVKLLGAISCCADPDGDCPGAIEYGWPLVTEAWLDLMAARHLNFVHVRLGPMVSKRVDPEGEPRDDAQAYELAPGGKYDLDRWNEAYWTRLRKLISYARDHGIYFQVDIADTWVMQHRHSPWCAEFNVQGWEGADLALMRAAPTPRHEAWIRKVVRETAGFDNVLYQDGNESFKAASRKWVFGMRNIVADEHGRMGILDVRPFGTNSQNEEIERGCDYGVWHSREAPPATSYPRITNEYDSERNDDGSYSFPPADVLEQVRLAWASGGRLHYQYWRGSHGCDDFKALLLKLQGVVDGTDVPPAIPDSCPALVRWGSKLYYTMDAAFQITPGPVRGGYVVVDSTPRFGSGRGLPCNAEHHEVCGGENWRKCEDPRGGLWTLEEGEPEQPLHLQSDDFQCRVGPLRPGHYKLRVRPRPDCQDHYGKPVTVVGEASTVTEWDVP